MNDSSQTTLALARQLGQQLSRAGRRVTAAESCTGGGVAYAITAVPGSSSWFDAAFVTYSSAQKQQLLGVSDNALTSGAVSEPVVLAMLEGALARSGADFGVAISGIAGPDGGTVDKPVGTVCFAVGGSDGRACTVHFSGDRQQVRQQAVDYALKLLIEQSSAENTV